MDGCGCGRRQFLGALAALPLMAGATRAEDEECLVFDAARQQAKTPDEVLQRLLDGNARFLSGKTINCDLMEQVRATAHGQAPVAAVVGCMDSRVPPELVFDQRIGSIFAIRIAGNFVNTDIIGSLEYAAKVVGSKLVVVLGHSECGAVKGAIDHVMLGNLTATLSNILPAVEQTETSGEQSSKNKAFVQAVADTNVRLAAKMLRERSQILDELADAGALKIVSAMHDVSTGKVSLLG